MRSTTIFQSLIAALLVTLIPHTLFAVDTFWNVAGPADWNVGTNWNTNNVPVAADRALIGNGGTADITANVPNVLNFHIGQTGGTGTVNHSAGTLTSDNWIVVGSDNTGTYNVSGTAVVNQNVDFLTVGENNGSNGLLDLSGTAQINTAEVRVARNGTAIGHIEQTGGTINVFDNGALAGDGSMKIGYNTPNGTYDLNSGTVTIAQDLRVGDLAAGVGVMTMLDGSVTASRAVIAGENGDGTITQSGGSVTANQWLILARNADSTGVYNLSGGTATGTLTVNIGENGDGTMNVSGDGQLISGGQVEVSRSGISTGLLTVADAGVVTAATDMRIGLNAGSDGTVTQTGGDVNVNNAGGGEGGLFVGDSGTGVYNMDGGTLDVAKQIQIGRTGSGVGTVNQTSGTVTANEWVNIGFNGEGAYNLSGGTLNANHDLNIGDQNGPAAVDGTLTVSGTGDLNVGINTFVGKNGSTGLMEVIGSTATIDVAGNYTQNALSTLFYEPDSSGVTSLDVTGAVNVDGTLAFDFGPSGITSAFDIGDIVLIDNAAADAIVGQYDGRPELSTVINFGTSAYWLTYQYDSVTGTLTGNDLALIAVPEPSTLLLAALGLLGAAGWITRRRRKR